MDKICVVIDLEGFQVKSRGGFQVRELGYCDWQRHHAGSYRYQLPGYLKDLPKQDQLTVKYVTKHVHGLPYRAFSREKARPADEIHEDVRGLYERHRTSERNVVGYKGGHVERDLLNELNIPSHDLEQDGCPPFGRMELLGGVEGCGHHKDPSTHHCALVECVHFVNWMRRQSGLSFQTADKYVWKDDQYGIELPNAQTMMESRINYTHPGFAHVFLQRSQELTDKTNELLATVEELNQQRLFWQWRCDALLDHILCWKCQVEKDEAFKAGDGLSWIPDRLCCQEAYRTLFLGMKNGDLAERAQYADSGWHCIKALQEVRETIWGRDSEGASSPRHEWN